MIRQGYGGYDYLQLKIYYYLKPNIYLHIKIVFIYIKTIFMKKKT